MKVLVVSQYFPPEPFRVGDFVNGLQQRGCEVTVLTGFPNYPKGKIYDGYKQSLCQIEYKEGIRIIRVPIFPDTSYSKWRRILNYLSFPISAFLIGLFVIRSRDYQKIVTWQLSPVTIALPSILLRFFQRSKAPIFHYVQDLWPESLEASGQVKNIKILRLVDIIVKFIYKSSNKILIQSKNMSEKIEKYGIAKNDIIYLPNWSEDIYIPVIKNREIAQIEGLDQSFNVIFAGNLGAAQNLEILIQAARELVSFSNIKIVIYGDGSNRIFLEKIAKDLPNVFFKGRRLPEEMPQLFALAHVTVVSLKRNPIFELTIPSKIQSYLACGRPIIAALEGSGATIIEEANAGLVCRPEDHIALKDAILSLYQMDSTQLEQLGVNGRYYYEQHFAREKVLDRFLELLAE